MAKVSFVVSVYNGEMHLAETVRSLFAQDLKDIEFVFINDGSTDGTYDLLEYYHNLDDRVKVYHLKKNSGISVARNLGTFMASSDIICIADADDYYAPYRARLSYNALKTGKYDAFYGAFLRSGENINDIQEGLLPDGTSAAVCEAVPYKKGCLDDRQVIPHPFLSVTKDFMLRTPYRSELRVGIDYPFLKDLEANGCRFKWTQKVLGTYRIHKNSVSISRRAEVNKSTDLVGGKHE